MVKPGDTVKGVEICKTDNVDDKGYEGYEITIDFGNEAIYYERFKTIPELEDQPNGIYHYDGKKYIQIETHE